LSTLTSHSETGSGVATGAELLATPENTIETFDEAIAAALPFADPGYLFNCTKKRYIDRLHLLREHIGIAGELADTLAERGDAQVKVAIGDPVIRAAINEGLAQIRFGRSTFTVRETEEIFEIALQQLRAAGRISVLQCGVPEPIRFRAEQPHGWFWTNERQEDAPTRFFRKLYGTLEEGKSVLATPTEEERENISRAIGLLKTVLPRVSASALEHVHLMCICDVPEQHVSKAVHFNSFTTIKVPGTIFLGRDLITDPWRTAEAILHESLHEKLYCFQHTHSLFAKEADVNVAPKVCSVWNRPTAQKNNWWPLSRAVFAFHVYVHLAVLFEAMQKHCARLESLFGPRSNYDLDKWKRRAFDRAHYLGHEISRHGQDLGPAGHALVSWLTALMSERDSAAPEPGSYVHLLLDLYDRETPQLAAKLCSQSADVALHRELQRRIQAEQQLVGRILSTLNLSAPATIQGAGDLSDFQTARKKIRNSLCGISLSQCELQVSADPEAITVGKAVEALVLAPEQYAA
jgi:hypothetical protein